MRSLEPQLKLKDIIYFIGDGEAVLLYNDKGLIIWGSRYTSIKEDASVKKYFNKDIKTIWTDILNGESCISIVLK